MLRNVSRLIAGCALALSAVVVALPGQAATADGTFAWTKITTPASMVTYQFDSSEGAVNHLTISGLASGDVPSVNIVCVVTATTGIQIGPLATNVPVGGGAFSVEATVPSLFPPCRLRALPTNLPTTPGFYMGAYSGPIMYSYTFASIKDGTKIVGFAAGSGVGSGFAAMADAAQCAVAGLATIIVPEVELRGPNTPQCAFGLHPINLTASGISTASAIRVDGKNAYLPHSVSGYLRSPSGLNLSLTQPSITTTFSRNSSTGDVKITESGRLWRCNGDNTFPPTAESCASLVNTGVTFKRVLDLIRGSHQVLTHDSYVSNDHHAHAVTSQYQTTLTPSQLGALGYVYPRHGSTFRQSTSGQVVTGFGTGAGTVLVRSNIYASSTDTQADTLALTWSRPPTRIQFSPDDPGRLAMPYTFTVPSNGTARIAFADSEAPYTADAKALAAKAVAAL
jgi:hypothetical protein